MSSSGELIRAAKKCHTKEGWGSFLNLYGPALRSASDSKPIVEIFKHLKQDPQSLQYEPELWESLLEGCLSSWNLELGSTITNYTKNIPSVKIAIPAAKVYAENGQPQMAREISSRALRLTNISPKDKLQLEIILCLSCVEEGKRTRAIRILNKTQEEIKTTELAPTNKAEFFVDLARANFFLGRYPQAGELFYEGYNIHHELKNWYEAARSVYNAASSFFSAGGKHQARAFPLVEKCRRIAEPYKLYGPLSHVEAFYGHDDYWHGDFAGARDHYRRAHKYIPSSDQSYRTLHVLSMLTFIYLRTGQFALARKFGNKTLELAKKDESQRFRSRYDNLRAELMWEDGLISESQLFLQEKTQNLFDKGVNTLEELSSLGRYYLQCAMLRDDSVTFTSKISDQLKKNNGDWIEFLYAKSQLHLSQGTYKSAKQSFEQCLANSQQYSDKYHYGLSLLGLIQISLATNQVDDKLTDLIDKFEIAMAKLVETPVKVHIHFIRASLAYRSGDFESCKRHLKAASTQSRITFTDKFILQAWSKTIEGHSCRIHLDWQKSMISHLTKIYFQPNLTPLGDRRFLISNHYEVCLTKQPAISDLLEFLLQKNKYQTSPSDIQKFVWKQSLQQQGWQQKIRNSITRMRTYFPYTIAPLLLHNDKIEMFSEAIDIHPMSRQDLSPKDEILRLLKEGPMSTVHLSNRINVSQATTKRLLKNLVEGDEITVMKVGRKVLYQSIEGS